MSKLRATVKDRPIYDSVEQLAGELGISRQSAYNGLRQGTIPAIRIGRRFIVARTAIADWLKNSGQQGAAR